MRALLCLCLLLVGCKQPPAPPPPSNVASATSLGAATVERLNLISAQADAGLFAAGHVLEPNAQAAVTGPYSVIRSLAGGPAPDKMRADAMSLVVQALAGKLNESNTGWAEARANSEGLSRRIVDLEAKVQGERIAAATELQRQLQFARDEARQKAEAREQFFKTMIFTGLGSIFLLAAVGSVFFRAYLPMFGPRVTACLAVAGCVLITTGIIVRAVSRLIDDHPFIFWGGILVSVAAAFIAVGLMISNHLHDKDEAKAIAVVPVPVPVPATPARKMTLTPT